jgi:hypothetical protein
MNGATQKVEQLDNDRLTITELIQVNIFIFESNLKFSYLANNGFNN